MRKDAEAKAPAKPWPFCHKRPWKHEKDQNHSGCCLNSVHPQAPHGDIELPMDGMVIMSEMDLDLTTRHRNPQRSFRILLAAALLTVSGALAFGVSQAAQPTVIIPPHVDDSGDLAPVMGEFTGSITSPARLAQSVSVAERSTLSGEERKFLLSLLMICFSVMSLGSFILWRRGFRELAKCHVDDK
ncbi:hypothetical protein [Peteryoungia ipomoeae]|uniref:Transmembrane protein n=1 Tax=Peteryoungia ipomoeae TaxID=1210932 RepID=A0A4S8P5Y4_9HYPH|nr:hypothetical protein [Peteryoungia ipomoeae]THV24751.1 hypothetical protein FAA97_00610 [Peteryoungia ipomoeae]